MDRAGREIESAFKGPRPDINEEKRLSDRSPGRTDASPRESPQRDARMGVKSGYIRSGRGREGRHANRATIENATAPASIGA